MQTDTDTTPEDREREKRRTITLPDCITDEQADLLVKALAMMPEHAAAHKGIGTIALCGTYGDHGGYIYMHGPDPMVEMLGATITEAGQIMKSMDLMASLMKDLNDAGTQAPGGPVHTDTTLKDI